MKKMLSMILVLVLCLATAAVAEGGYAFSFVNNCISDTHWQGIYAGMLAACDELNSEVTMLGGTNQMDMDTYMKNIETAAKSKPDGLICVCFSEDTLGETINSVVDSGTPVGLVDTDGPNTKRSFYVGLDEYDCGRQTALLTLDKLGADWDGNGEIIWFCYAQSNKKMVDRYNGFMDTVYAKYPNAKVSYEIPNDASNVLTNAQQIEQLLLAHPDTVAIAVAGQLLTAGAAQAVEAKDKAGKIVLVGLGDDENLLNGVMAGTITALVGIQTYAIGYQTIYTFVGLLNGEEVENTSIAPALIWVDSENAQEYLDNKWNSDFMDASKEQVAKVEAALEG